MTGRTHWAPREFAAGSCGPCGKRAYPSRREARARAKQIPGTHMNAYRCPHGAGWHLGHLPDDVRHGDLPKDEYLLRAAAHRATRARGAS